MPFTLSHAAAALPFRRTRLVPSALVTGCFAPDFEYFLGHHGAFGHTVPGMFLMDLPLSFAALWLFHHFLKEPLAACLPRGARERLDLGPKSLKIDSAGRFALIVLSILVGIATHIAWDSFTHQGFLPAHRFDFLREMVTVPWFGPRPLYGVLQYISSIFGIVVILLWYAHWYRSSSPIHPDPFEPRSITMTRLFFGCAFAAAALAGILRAAVFGIPRGITGSQKFATHAVIAAITVFWIEVLIYGFIWNVRTKRTRDRVKQSL